MLAMLFSVHLSLAQQTVTGIVSDDNGALPGVTISVKGTTKGTQTDAQGRYSIEASPGETLRYSMIGYLAQEILVTQAKTINVTLKSDLEDLGEVVVTAMGIKREEILRLFFSRS